MPEDTRGTKDNLPLQLAIIKDPTLHGNKELFLLHSKEFQKAVRNVRSDREGKSEWEKWFQFIQTQLNNQLNRNGRFLDSFHDGTFRPRLALFGPGIESPRTKHLVHRMVQAHNSSFNAIDFVAGLPGILLIQIIRFVDQLPQLYTLYRSRLFIKCSHNSRRIWFRREN